MWSLSSNYTQCKINHFNVTEDFPCTLSTELNQQTSPLDYEYLTLHVCNLADLGLSITTGHKLLVKWHAQY